MELNILSFIVTALLILIPNFFFIYHLCKNSKLN